MYLEDKSFLESEYKKYKEESISNFSLYIKLKIKYWIMRMYVCELLGNRITKHRCRIMI